MAERHLAATESHPLAQVSRAAGVRWRTVIAYGRRSPLGLAAFAFIAFLVVIAVFAPLIAPFDPLQLHRVDRLSPPNSTYWLGTDQSGRDQFSRVLYGTRISLYVGVVPILVSGTIGTAIGVISGYCGGVADSIIQRFADALMAIPALVVALTLVALLGPSANNVVIAIAVVTAPTINRVARAETLQVMNLPYITAAVSAGASHTRLLCRHVIPNVVGTIVVVGTSLVGGAILAEAGLSFLGVGVQPPTPSWGNMVGGQNLAIFSVAPWLVIFPGIAITLAVLAFNLAGDSVRDLLDPRSRGRGP